jgi:hypothetical protein
VSTLSDPVDRRRQQRLRGELVDEQVPLPLDGPGGEALLEEVGFARQPPVHEGRPPRYGAVVAITAGLTPPPGVTWVAGEGLDLEALRPSADGRSSFVVRGLDDWVGLVAVDHTVEHEADLVRFRNTGTVLIQRTAGGLVRICTDDGIITWDSMNWRFKPSADRLTGRIFPLLADVDRSVLGDLLDLGVHWLSAERVGATIVWHQGDGSVGDVDRAPAVPAPELKLTDRAHRSAWLSLLGQLDRAVVVDRAGSLVDVGVTLGSSAEAAATVPPLGGTRHTSARHFSYDHDDVVVLVVSEDGPVSVFSGGAEVGEAAADTCRSGPDLLRSGPDPATVRVEDCPHCGRPLRIAVADFPAWEGGPDEVTCPVCERPFPVEAYRADALAAARPSR